jgi:hypothetical protein
VHDYFEILGVSPDARARDIQRACRRRAPAVHPDFRQEADVPARLRESAPDPDWAQEAVADAAIDFVEIGKVVARMQAAFFATIPPRGR